MRNKCEKTISKITSHSLPYGMQFSWNSLFASFCAKYFYVFVAIERTNRGEKVLCINEVNMKGFPNAINSTKNSQAHTHTHRRFVWYYYKIYNGWQISDACLVRYVYCCVKTVFSQRNIRVVSHTPKCKSKIHCRNCAPINSIFSCKQRKSERKSMKEEGKKSNTNLHKEYFTTYHIKCIVHLHQIRSIFSQHSPFIYTYEYIPAYTQLETYQQKKEIVCYGNN